MAQASLNHAHTNLIAVEVQSNSILTFFSVDEFLARDVGQCQGEDSSLLYAVCCNMLFMNP